MKKGVVESWSDGALVLYEGFFRSFSGRVVKPQMKTGIIKMKHKIYVIILLLPLLFSISVGNAQIYLKMFGYSTDTIFPKLRDASEKEKMHLFNELAFYHSIYHADSAFYYAEKALQLAEKYDDKYEKGVSYRNLGNSNALKGDLNQAVYFLQKALSIFVDLKHKRKIFELNYDLSKLNYDLEDYERCIAYSKRCEELIAQQRLEGKELVTPIEYALHMGFSGIIRRESGDYDEGIEYLKRYIALSKSLEIPAQFHSVFVQSLAEIYQYAGQYDSALKYTYETRKILPENKNKPPLEFTGLESSIGKLLYNKGNTMEAIPFLRQSLNNKKQSFSLFYAATNACYLGDAFLSLKMYDSANYYYWNAIKYSNKMYQQLFRDTTGAPQQNVYSGYQTFFEISRNESLQRYYRQMYFSYSRIYMLYKSLGEAIPALENHEKMTTYKDSFNIVSNNIEEKKLQARFQTERYEQQLSLLEKDNILKESQLKNNRLIFFGAIIMLLFILFVVILFFRQQRLKALQEKLQIEQRLLRSQMNPHFIFNSLASVQNFIVKQDDTKASIYLSRFSELVRSILNNSIEEQITLEEELNTIENYLELQKVRFPEKFSYSIELDEKIDPENTLVPPMLAQPFIENAIEHGIKHKGSKGNIHVRFKMDKQKLIYEVEDDGIGREKAQEILKKQNSDHKSLATTITQERIKVLNKKLKYKIRLEIIDLKNNTGEPMGTKVVFEMPF